MKKLGVAIVLLVAALAGCNKKAADKAPETNAGSGATTTPQTGSAGSAGMAGSAGSAAEVAWDGKTPLSLEGFQTPESVLYDADGDGYLVSNIGGQPLDLDDNGFISKISPDGKITELKWIDGAKDNIKLNAPKGMAITGGLLYVADIDTVHKFDAKTGELKGDIKIDGATFLNDVAVAPDGGVYVTDSGLDKEFKGTGSDAVYMIGKDDKVKPVMKDKKLAAPNGITAGDKGAVWVVTFGSGEIYEVDAKGKQGKNQNLPKGQLDGVVVLDGGEVLVSSWEGSAIYRGKPGAEWKPVVENVKSPADIGYDTKRHRILIPVFMGNTVIIQPTE
ncbi:MAG TPA: SMP-30/gluconolactonase/LRE family protein [Kofleriaceae bacterium]|nr:SMP-30/gluconolactonase/LRE family protein [Kofleriaceae bacterium]